MSETLESALALARELAEAFKTGAKTPVPSVAGKAGAEAVCVPPKFPAEKPDAPAGTKGRGRLPSTRGQTEANYAKQLSGTAMLPAKKAGGKPELECSGALHISLFFDGTCCNQEDADDVYGSDRPPLTNIGRLYGAANYYRAIAEHNNSY